MNKENCRFCGKPISQKFSMDIHLDDQTYSLDLDCLALNRPEIYDYFMLFRKVETEK